MTKHS